MKCPYCAKEIHFEEEEEISHVYKQNDKITEKSNGFVILSGHCPSCFNFILIKVDALFTDTVEYNIESNDSLQLLFPIGFNRPISLLVPENYRVDFEEANSVLNLSPKASAALSRRLLQKLLEAELFIKKRNLSVEIDDFIKIKGVPSYLIESVDAIRNVGNFAAHPMKDTNTGEVVDVEAGEAEWILDVVEVLFDYIFIQPAKTQKMKEKLNKKLEKLGKPQMKSLNDI